MTEKLTRIYLTARDDEGQGALEYIGILAVVVAVITLVVAAVNGADVATGLQDLINQVLGQ